MCTEFFLAIVYFITIFFINFFLYKLLSTYIKNIIYLLKVKNVLQFHPLKSLNIFILLHLYGKKSQNEVKEYLFAKGLLPELEPNRHNKSYRAKIGLADLILANLNYSEPK